MREAAPAAVVHLLTALPAAGPLRPADLRATNRLRLDGTRHLLAAARSAGVRRIVAESFAGVYGPMPAAPTAIDELAVMADPGRGALRDTVLALRGLEAQLRDATTDGRLQAVALRFGGVYGPGVASTELLIAQARAGRLFAPADPGGVFSFVHVEDAARAIVAALVHEAPGPVHDVADDVPMSIARVLALTSEAFSGRAPRRLPGWLVRLVAPVTAEMMQLRLPLANRRLRTELAWAPRVASVPDGLRAMTRDHGVAA